jgi:hypothetical protein
VDAFTLLLWLVRIGFVVLIWVVLLVIVRALWRDLRTAVQVASSSLGRLIVTRSPAGLPEEGISIPLDAVATLGSDVNNTVAIEDAAVAPVQALLTFRGRAWYLEDRGGGGAIRVNGRPVETAAVLGYGDEIGLGSVRLRLERAHGDPLDARP